MDVVAFVVALMSAMKNQPNRCTLDMQLAFHPVK